MFGNRADLLAVWDLDPDKLTAAQLEKLVDACYIKPTTATL